MQRHLFCITSLLAVVISLAGLRTVEAANWLISTSAGTLWDYSQGGGAAINPRAISPSLPTLVTGVDFGGDGSLYAMTVFSNNSLYKINPTTGARTLVGSTGLSGIIEGDLGFDPSTGNLYGLWNDVVGVGNQFFTLNTTTGAATVVGTIAGDDLSGLAFDNSGQMWVIDSQVNTTDIPRLLKVNKANGSISSTLSTGVTLPNVALLGADFDPTTNELYFATGNGSFYHANTSTGAATLIGTHGVTNASGLAYVLVPEPASVILLLMASILLVRNYGRRR